MITYYTDGSCEPNPGTGGFAVIKEMQSHILGGETSPTTNIRMEGLAYRGAHRCRRPRRSTPIANFDQRYPNGPRIQKAGQWRDQNLDIVKSISAYWSPAELIGRGTAMTRQQAADHWQTRPGNSN
jgi:hypothetical protein